MKENKPRSDRRIAGLIAFGVVLYALLTNPGRLGQIFTWLMTLLTPILMGLAFALVLNVPMHGFQTILHKIDKKQKISTKLRDVLALVLSIVLVPILLMVLIRFIVPQFISAITNVINIINANEEKIGQFVARIGLDPTFVTDKLHELGQWISTNITQIAGTTVNAAVSVFASITDVLLALIMAIYMLADKTAIIDRSKKIVRAFLPEKLADYACHAGSMFTSTFRIFLSRQCLEAVILGGLILICMLIFRMPYAVTICCMTALLALLPYIGAYISLGVGCILIFTVSPMKALGFAAIFLVAQQVEGNLIYPRVVGSSVGLPAYLTLAAVMLGGALAGIAGMFFIIPIVSVIYVLLNEAVERRTEERLKAGEITSNDPS